MLVFPKITVIVPAFNEERWVGKCLDNLKSQTYPKERYEVILVDNGSTDKTANIALQKGAKVLLENRKSPYAARNLAIDQSEGEWLAFTDADCLVDSEWLMKLWRYAVENDLKILSGLTLYRIKEDSYGNIHYFHTHQPEQLKAAVLIQKCIAGNNMFVNRSIFTDIGYFNVIRSGSDIEFSKRAAASGFEIGFAKEAVVMHQCDLSSIQYLRRSFRIRYGQAMHSPESGITGFLRYLGTIPWRPGFNTPLPKLDKSMQKPNAIGWALYCWLNRWMGFFGSQYALMTKSRSREIG